MLVKSPPSSTLLVDTIQEAALDVVPVIAQKACTLARQSVNRGSRSRMQQTGLHLRKWSLDETILKQGEESTRDVLCAPAIKFGKLRGRCQSESGDILQDSDVARGDPQRSRLLRPLEELPTFLQCRWHDQF